MDAFGGHRLSDDQLLCDEYLAGDTPGAGNKYSWHKYFYAAGRRIGNLGNNGAETVDYATELKMRESSLDAALQAQKQAAAGSSGADNDSRFKRFAPSCSVDFDENYQPINSSYPGGAICSRHNASLSLTPTSIQSAQVSEKRFGMRRWSDRTLTPGCRFWLTQKLRPNSAQGNGFQRIA